MGSVATLKMAAIVVAVIVAFASCSNADSPLFSKPSKKDAAANRGGGRSGGSSADGASANPVQQQYQQYQQNPQFQQFLQQQKSSQESQPPQYRPQAYQALPAPQAPLALPAPQAHLAIQAPPSHQASLAIQPYQAQQASQTPQTQQAIQPYQTPSAPSAPQASQVPWAPQAYQPPTPIMPVHAGDVLVPYGSASSDKPKSMEKLKSFMGSVGKLTGGGGKKKVKSIEGSPQQQQQPQLGYYNPQQQPQHQQNPQQLGFYNPQQQPQQPPGYHNQQQLGFLNPQQQQQQQQQPGYYNQQQLGLYNYQQPQQFGYPQQPEQPKPPTEDETRLAYRKLYNWSEVLSRQEVVKELHNLLGYTGSKKLKFDHDEISPNLLLQYNDPKKEYCNDYGYIKEMKKWRDVTQNNSHGNKMLGLRKYLQEVFDEQTKMCNFAKMAAEEFGKFKQQDPERWGRLEAWMEVASNYAKSNTNYQSHFTNHIMLNEAIKELTESHGGSSHEKWAYATKMINTLRDYCTGVGEYRALLDMTEVDLGWREDTVVRRLHKLMTLCDQTRAGNYESALAGYMHSNEDNAWWNQYMESRQAWA